MASSLMDLLMSRPSAQDRFMSILPLLSQSGTGASSPGSGLLGTSSGSSTGTVVPPSGPTQYPYTEYDKPYTGTPDMISRYGISLQPGAMRSLIDIARESDLMRGAKEIGQIGVGYRPASSQPAGGRAAGPGVLPAAAPGYSYHQQGLAIDADWWRQNLLQELLAAGWNWGQSFNDPVHFSYGVSG